jgi:pSer/pThr/pTyr-binding forkhead associated (FHA) protein
MDVKLVVIHGRPANKSLVFPRGAYVFGRGSECHIRPNSDWVSRQHCQLLVTADSVSIRDLGSRNGTLVNGERVMGHRGLADGDRLQIGPLVFEVRLGGITQAEAATTVTGDTEAVNFDTAQIAALEEARARLGLQTDPSQPTPCPTPAEHSVAPSR